MFLASLLLFATDNKGISILSVLELYAWHEFLCIVRVFKR